MTKLIKSFLYNNSCVLCVWARYCLFLLLGLNLHRFTSFDPSVYVAVLMALILLLKLVD